MKIVDSRAIESLSFQQLEVRWPCYAQVLLRLRSWRVLASTMVRAIWPRLPEPVNCSYGLNRLERAELIEWSPDRRVIQLGRRGARLFRQIRYRPIPAARVLDGMLLLSNLALAIEVGVSPGRSRRYRVAGRTQAFSGQIVRPDGMLALIGRSASHPDSLPAFTLWQPQPLLAADERLWHIALEIDDCSERPRQLTARFANWQRALAQPALAQLPDPARLTVIHLTTGGMRRSRTIRTAWCANTTQDALFASREHLRQSSTGILDVVRGHWTTAHGETLSGTDVFLPNGYLTKHLEEESNDL